MDDFEQIYRTYLTDVYRYIRRLSGSEQIAEEIASETFLKAMDALKHFRGDCDIRVWLCQIAKNLYFSQLRQEKQQTTYCELPELPGDPSPEEGLVRQADVLQIRRILHSIPEPYKEVFMWRVYAQLSFRQIGTLYGKTENWACVTYHRACTRIRKQLEEETYET